MLCSSNWGTTVQLTRCLLLNAFIPLKCGNLLSGAERRDSRKCINRQPPPNLLVIVSEIWGILRIPSLWFGFWFSTCGISASPICKLHLHNSVGFNNSAKISIPPSLYERSKDAKISYFWMHTWQPAWSMVRLQLIIMCSFVSALLFSRCASLDASQRNNPLSLINWLVCPLADSKFYARTQCQISPSRTIRHT